MTPQAPIPLPETFDEAGFEELKAEIAAYVADEGEEWTRRIEAERAVPPELRVELKERGYLSLAGPVEYGGRGIPFSRYLELLELFAMSHASLRMIVHVANGVWRSVDQFATEEQRRDYVMPAVTGDLTVAFTLTEPTAGTGADLRCEVEREGDTYYLSGEKHLITFGVSCDRWLLFARLAGTTGAEGTVALLVDRDTPNVQVEDMGESLGVRGHRPRAPGLRPRPGAGQRHARRGGQGAAGRLRRLPHPEPDRRRDDLRRAGAAGPGAGRRARRAARHLRQTAVAAPGDLLRAGRERRRHRSLAPAGPARGAALGGGRRPTRRSSPRWRS